MTLDEWMKSPVHRDRYRKILSDPVMIDAISVLRSISYSRTSPQLAQGGCGDRLFGQIQGEESVFHNMEILMNEPVEQKTVKQTYSRGNES